MATGGTGFDGVPFDLMSLPCHSPKAGHDDGRYVRDACTAGRDDIADFFEQVMAQDSERTRHNRMPPGHGETPAANRPGSWWSLLPESNWRPSHYE